MNEDKIRGCKCRNCGIELILQNQPADTYCRFCGAPALTAQSFESAAQPDLVIPFETDKHHARQMFLKYLSARPLVSSVFSQKVKSGNFASLYIPVCLADIGLLTDITTSDSQGNKSAEQLASAAKNATASMGTAANDYLLQDIGPFDFSRAIPYGERPADIPYERLSSLPAEKLLARPIDELEASRTKAATDMIADSVQDKHIINCHTAEITHSCKSVLVPVWVLNLCGKGYSHQIFLNGQNGRIIGEPPISPKRVAGIFGITAAVCAVVGEAIWMAVNYL